MQICGLFVLKGIYSSLKVAFSQGSTNHQELSHTHTPSNSSHTCRKSPLNRVLGFGWTPLILPKLGPGSVELMGGGRWVLLLEATGCGSKNGKWNQRLKPRKP